MLLPSLTLTCAYKKDVMLPRPFQAKLWVKDPKKAYTDVKDSIFNKVKNVVACVLITFETADILTDLGCSMLTLRRESGVSTLSAKMAPPRIDGPDVPYSRFGGIFSTSSTKDSALMGPLRAIALEAYEQLNKGVAKCVFPDSFYT